VTRNFDLVWSMTRQYGNEQQHKKMRYGLHHRPFDEVSRRFSDCQTCGRQRRLSFDSNIGARHPEHARLRKGERV
jgi:hypothetical protein